MPRSQLLGADPGRIVRVVALALAVLACAAPARADVLVPADPRFPFDGDCVAAAGDVLAVGRELVDGWTIQATAGDDVVQPLLGDDSGQPETCPVAAAAPDGTAAVAASTTGVARLAIRRPGGTFGAPTALGRVHSAPAVAVAPGGWIAVAWVRAASGSRDRALTVLVLSPDGRASKTVLDRGQTLGRPRMVIAPDGTVTVAWSAPGRRIPRRWAERRGGTWSAPIELPGSNPVSGEAFALTMAPSGRRLLAWSDDDGVRVQLDGEPLATVAPFTDNTKVAAALADDGTAVVAFAGDDGAVQVVDRPAGGAWPAPHQVLPSSAEEGELDVVLAPGARAVVASPVERRIAAATGTAGGPWDRSLVSAPTRDATAFDLTRDAAGEPWLVWAEPNGPDAAGPLRGAKLAASAPADTTPPTFSVTVPRKLADTRNALNLDIPIAVRCDEACDVRAAFRADAYSAYDAPANRRTTFHLDAASERETLLSRPGRRVLRFTVTVSDRAGNLASRRVRVPIRILQASVRSFKVPADHDFGLSSRAGNRDAVRFVNRVIEDVASRRLRRTGQIAVVVDRGLARLERDYDEAVTGAVQDAIYDALAIPLRRAGFDPARVFG